MKRYILFPAIAFMSLGLVSLDMSARGRNDASTSSLTSKATGTSSVNTAAPRPGGSPTTPSRPGTSTTTQRPGSTSKPSTPTPPPSSSVNKPGNTPARPSTPSASTTPPRPTNTPVPNRPATHPGPTPGNGNSMRPPTSYRPGYNYTPPRPATPPSYVYTRPSRPSTWRPGSNSFNLSTILGITFGTIISNSVNSLINSGYNVSGYNTNEVYLNNVSYLNTVWPNATLYYNNGYLEASMFSNASSFFDMTRYNYVYRELTSMYGAPYTTSNLPNGGMSCTWWGNGNSYLTLSYYPEYTAGLGTYYYTTLTVGN